MLRVVVNLLAISRTKLIVGAGIVIVAVAAMTTHRLTTTPSNHLVSATETPVPSDAIYRKRSLADENLPAAGSPAGQSGWMNYRKSFAASRDYWNLAHQLLPAAKSGDADAQFYLARLLEQCEEGNRMYFQKHGKSLTLDEGLQFAVQRHLPMELAQTVFDRCHEFQNHDLTEWGSAKDWLAKSTAAGQPLAEVTTASKIFAQELMQNFVKAGGVPDSNAMTQVDSGADPRELLRAAVESRDPEVLFEIGEVQGLLNPSGIDNSTKRLAWFLVACERGLDCSTNAEWVKNTCASDPQCASVSSSSDIVRMFAGDNWPNVQQRAQDISAKLDAGQWDELGIGS